MIRSRLFGVFAALGLLAVLFAANGCSSENTEPPPHPAAMDPQTKQFEDQRAIGAAADAQKAAAARAKAGRQ